MPDHGLKGEERALIPVLDATSVEKEVTSPETVMRFGDRDEEIEKGVTGIYM